MSPEVIAEAVVELDTRPPFVHRTAITGLRINQELLATIGRRVNSGAAFGALRDGCVELAAQTIVQYDPRRGFPRVLGIKLESAAADGRRTDVLPIGEVRGRHSPRVGKRAASEQSRKRVGQRVADTYVVGAAL